MSSFKHGKFHGLNITIGNDKVVVNLFNNGDKQSNFAFDRSFVELEGLYRRVGTALNHLSTDHLNPAVEDPQPANFREPEPIPEETLQNLKLSHDKGKMKYTVDPFKTGNAVCAWCQFMCPEAKCFATPDLEYILCTFCAVA